MKRSATDDFQSSSQKRALNATHSPAQTSPPPYYSNASPASITSASPQYTPQHRRSPRESKKYVGCSRITDYELDDKLGEGTFGEVHKARRKATGELVALKRILMHNEKDGVPITAIREIKILKELHHKNIVPLSDIAVQKGNRSRKERTSIYMVFPYMDHDLAGLLENPSVKLSVPQIKTYMKQLLEGTSYLHHNKILHRDMKAANLLINNEGILQIADFGLARGLEEDGKEYTNCVVTRWYRPPELFLGERRYTTAIDMWGVGCVFGEMLKSRPILQGSTDLDQLQKIFRLCGSPTSETMPDWENLPQANTVTFGPYQRRVKDEFSAYGPQACSLLDQLLVLDKNKRLTADAALDHDYFWTAPLPADPADLPKYEASHEYDRRKQKQDHHNGNGPHKPVRDAPIGAPPHQALPSSNYAGRHGYGSNQTVRKSDNDRYRDRHHHDKYDRRDDRDRDRGRDRDRDGDRHSRNDHSSKDYRPHPLPARPSTTVPPAPSKRY